MPSVFKFDNPDAAIGALAERLSTVTETETSRTLHGRILATDAVADRDSPAADVSAMDGYAVRLNQISDHGQIDVRGECIPGSAPPPMPAAGVLRIFTGAVIPEGCDAVVKREDTIESADTIRWRTAALSTAAGMHIRRQGENTLRGTKTVSAGTILGPAQLASLCSFSVDQADVYRQIRVALITTGDELVRDAHTTMEPWQIRDSNRIAVESLVDRHRWIDSLTTLHSGDTLDVLTDTLRGALADQDAVILTGGVSMGDYDFVPAAAQAAGAETVFHKLPVRPGKPIFGAATSDGKLVLGLPGNPVSAAVGCRRFGIPLLSKIAGIAQWRQPCPALQLDTPPHKTIPLHWMRLVRISGHGTASPIIGKGSGDLVALGESDGFIETPPDNTAIGPWPFYAW